MIKRVTVVTRDCRDAVMSKEWRMPAHIESRAPHKSVERGARFLRPSRRHDRHAVTPGQHELFAVTHARHVVWSNHGRR